MSTVRRADATSNVFSDEQPPVYARRATGAPGRSVEHDPAGLHREPRRRRCAGPSECRTLSHRTAGRDGRFAETSPDPQRVRDERPMAETHVLFVEDDDVIREATQLALERDGFVVTAVPDGLTGLEAFRARPAGHRPARRDGAGAGRGQPVPPDPRRVDRAGDHAVRAGRLHRRGARAGGRRRRLRDQAVRRRGAGRPDPGGAAPVRARRRRRARRRTAAPGRCCLRRPGDRHRRHGGARGPASRWR